MYESAAALSSSAIACSKVAKPQTASKDRPPLLLEVAVVVVSSFVCVGGWVMCVCGKVGGGGEEEEEGPHHFSMAWVRHNVSHSTFPDAVHGQLSLFGSSLHI